MKRLFTGAIVGLAATTVGLLLWSVGLLERLEYATWSWRVAAFAGRTQPHPNLKIILLDQASLDWGKEENGWAWPWPRTVYGAVLDFCRRAGAKAVAFDVLFTEPSSYEAADDAALAESIRRTQGFAGALALEAKSGSATNWPAELHPAIPFQGLQQWLTPDRAREVILPRASFPIPEVATNAVLLGNVSDQPDADGQFRRASLFRVFDGRAIPGLGLAAFLAGEKSHGSTPAITLSDGWLQVGDRKVPIDSRGSTILEFHGTNGMHQSFSAAAVIQSEIRLQDNEKPVLPPEVFKDAYVFFGFSAPGLLDLRPTPLSRVSPGVEIHATCLDDLLTGRFLCNAPATVVWFVTLTLGLVGGALVALSRKTRQSLLAVACFLPLPVLIAFGAYPLGWWWPLVGPETAVASALAGGVILNYATEGRQKAFLKRAFKHYLGGEVIDQIVSDPARLRLGGEKRELTLFFSDIEKFSSFSEKLDPETLTGLLNDYLTDMTDIILEEGGYLDKYIGDAIVAFWNAPAAQPDHAVRAVRAVLRCQRKLAEQRAHYQSKTGVSIKARIGMNTGAVTVGNMGSRDRFNYTVLGDAANLASRLEGANKTFGTYNLISESTWSQCQDHFVGRELGCIRVVGRQQPVRVYEVLGLPGEPLPSFVRPFEHGLTLCREGRWQEALECFETQPDDPPSTAYAALCLLKLKAGAQPWDGVWNLTEK
ncbi:MAG: CHASE2 domain-containing protein [Verrucomicrobiia bacterium]